MTYGEDGEIIWVLKEPEPIVTVQPRHHANLIARPIPVPSVDCITNSTVPPYVQYTVEFMVEPSESRSTTGIANKVVPKELPAIVDITKSLPGPLFSRNYPIPDDIISIIKVLNELIPSQDYVITGGTARDLVLCKVPSDIDICIKELTKSTVIEALDQHKFGLSQYHDNMTLRVRTKMELEDMCLDIDFITTPDDPPYGQNFDFTANQVYLCPDMVFRATGRTWLDLDMHRLNLTVDREFNSTMALRAIRLSIKTGLALTSTVIANIEQAFAKGADEIYDRSFYVQYQKAINEGIEDAFAEKLCDFNMPLGEHLSMRSKFDSINPGDFKFYDNLEVTPYDD